MRKMTETVLLSPEKKTQWSKILFAFGAVWLLLALFELATGYSPPTRHHWHFRPIRPHEAYIDLTITAVLFAIGFVVKLFESKKS
jgi:hypothetical protein